MSAEQYRIWESIEAGCLIIILQRHVEEGSVLYPLQYLGFKYITVTSWAQLPELLLHLEEDKFLPHRIDRDREERQACEVLE
ncbi:hypothetical protein WJX75_005402 [Coccomyxa subellipsoidea]|uniref:Uncharacterized protein n=1 Tax=Coccomyxa subellipsoidea TaxID=248742 RepID=A0ABR2Z3S2_9CHLO